MEFQAWPKTPRLLRDVVITEKIDGTNAAIRFIPTEEIQKGAFNYLLTVDDSVVAVGAQSRNRLINPDQDNAGFARWVDENSASLFEDLGPGTHFGEWWGQGIQRKYGLDHKRFSLFNTHKWGEKSEEFKTPNLDVVPTLYHGILDQRAIQYCIEYLISEGSVAAPGFPNPEGICVYHTASRQVYKYTLDGDGHKGT